LSFLLASGWVFHFNSRVFGSADPNARFCRLEFAGLATAVTKANIKALLFLMMPKPNSPTNKFQWWMGFYL
jgi:hypothetical protein